MILWQRFHLPGQETQEIWVWFLDQEGPLEKETESAHSVFLPGEFHGQRSLVGCSPWGRKELNTTEHVLTHTPGCILRACYDWAKDQQNRDSEKPAAQRCCAQTDAHKSKAWPKAALFLISVNQGTSSLEPSTRCQIMMCFIQHWTPSKPGRNIWV